MRRRNCRADGSRKQCPGSSLANAARTFPPLIADALSKLARAYQGQGNSVEAERHYERALATYEEKLGKDARPVSITLHYLADVYERQGKYTKAEESYRRALAIMEEKLGKDHLD